MKKHIFRGVKVTLEKAEYQNNGTLALNLKTLDGEEYAVATVNLNHPLQSESRAFLDENNYPGIGKWIEQHHLGLPMGVLAASGYCRYPLYTLFTDEFNERRSQ